MHREYHPSAEPRRRRPFRWWTLLPWLLVAYAATGIYRVGPDEEAVVRRCGRLLPDRRGPGLHLGLPYGFDRVDRLKLLERKRVGVGTTLTERALGRPIAAQQEECLTGDRNLILVTAVVQYRIDRPRDYLLQVADVPALIRGVSASALRSVIASMTVDEILTENRIAIQNHVKEASQESLRKYGAGVSVESVSLEEVRAPEEVAEAFRDVAAAREDAQRTLNEAEGYAKRLIPEARGEAERMRLEAQGYATEVIEMAKGEADRFEMVRAELGEGRRLTVKRLILETLEEVLPRLRKVVVDASSGNRLDLSLFEEEP